MASRLDRLLQLLDSSPSQSVKHAIATQIAQIATKCLRKDAGIEGDVHDVKPSLDSEGNVITSKDRAEDWSEVLSVVSKLLPLLRSKHMETRVAASHTLSNICLLAPVWSPLHVPDGAKDETNVEFPPFSIEQILQSNNLLLSSSGQEFNKGARTAADLERARKETKTRLGLDFLDGDDDPDHGWTHELMEEATEEPHHLQNDDALANAKHAETKTDVTSPRSRTDDASSPMSLDAPFVPPISIHQTEHHPSDEPMESPTAEFHGDGILSVREKNRLKRKRRQEENGAGPIISRAPAPPVKIRVVEQEGKPTPKRAPSSPPADDEQKIVVDPQKGGQVEAKEKSPYHPLAINKDQWVWAGLVKVLLVDLFNPNWETRHGTTLALREVIKIQGAYAGTCYNATAAENAISHEKWCNDVAAKFLRVFVLDRFTDYVADQVTAPVRESATQALAALLIHMPATSVYRVHDILLEMIRQDFRSKKGGTPYAWQIRHAGLLGLKYEVAVRDDLVERKGDTKLLRGVVDAALLGLADADDDVRSAAAACLIPISGSIVRHLYQELSQLLVILWSCFESMKDDLGSSVSTVMDLLGSLVSFSEVMELFTDPSKSQSLDQLAPLLFPLFRHTISNVRLAVVRTLHAFLSVPELPIGWVDGSFLRLLFQNILLEEREDVRSLSLRTWRLALQKTISDSSAIDNLIPLTIFRDWIETCTTPIGDPIDVSRLFVLNSMDDSEGHNVDKSMLAQDLSLITAENVWKARLAAAQSLASLSHSLPQRLHQDYLDLPLKHYLNSPSFFHKVIGATTLQEWAIEYKSSTGNSLVSGYKLAEELNTITLNLVASDPPSCYHETYSLLDQLCRLCNSLVGSFLQDSKLNASNPGLPQQASINGTDGGFTLNHARTTVDWLDNLHNLFVKPKKKRDSTRIDDAKKNVREQIRTFEETKMNQDTQVMAALASAAFALEALPPKLSPLIKGVMNSIKGEANEDLQRRSASALAAFLTTLFGATLFDEIPRVWQCVSEELVKVFPQNSSISEGDTALKAESGQPFLDTLTALRDVLPTLDPALHPRVEQLFPSLLLGLQSTFAVIRQAVAKCFAVITDVMTPKAMLYLVENMLPLVDDLENIKNRQGIVELIFHVVGTLHIKVLPYIIFLVVPLLGRMNDIDEDIRSVATNSFATLVQLVPLEQGLPDPPGFPSSLLSRRDEERKFLSQLFDGSQAEDYRIPVKVNAELRKYQQEGVNWLAFLNKYKLHGILCDDMGLGKTLQSICILASLHHERQQRNEPHLTSLVVCPPTLTNHWRHEINKYVDNLRPVIYAGPIKERRLRVKKLDQYDVVITSYDVVRNDVNVLSGHNWLYCILDEGHMIKNARSKVAQAVKCMKAHHRLILSGTPIQNNLLEFWSLFDFLMPGLLGNETQFNERYARPVLASRDSKVGGKVVEAAARALEGIRKQVLPFVLRRMKENVLNDLPPKIIQDHYCDISPLQQLLFDEFQKSQASTAARDSIQTEGGKGHVFQALQYLRKVCNHPALVLKDNLPETTAIMDKLAERGEEVKPLRDVENAPKLLALRQLLQDCGIGTAPRDPDANGDNLESLSVEAPQHRCLIFCQMKLMIDAIETDLFQALMPTVSYMRLDGTVDAQQRHAIVQTFNEDPSIDCLLLTTHIGGLGLTLTGADTVIFVEHDWNPMKDLQAMDRAHRLGQKRVVNVYRLITKGTLEEKIMGLQRFKLNIANSVVTQQNAGLDSMDTDLVLDLFRKTSDEEDAALAKRKTTAGNGAVSQKNILDGLEELHGEDEYAEMNLDAFMSSLGR
ncbi:TATA-binding protein-associated factor mot1 [Serendipita sp. 405]|nr:TATA-binding protein-associated factor mot1 [Serendipita sp. 405]